MISKELRDRHMRMCQKFMMLRLDSLFSDLPRGEFMPLQTNLRLFSAQSRHKGNLCL